MKKASQLSQWDKKYIWHPFTQQADWKKDDPLIVESARGMYLKDVRGRRYLDGVSSLWVTVHGHNHPALNRALLRQLKKVAHATFLGLTHEPAIRLGRRLTRLAPPGLSRVFYSDNGATSVEVALKMAYQSGAESRGEKASFLALKNSYHGDTLGSVSVGGMALFHKKFKRLLFKARFAMSPHCYRCPFRKKNAPYAGRFRMGEIFRGPAPRPGQFRAETGCRWECLGSVEKILKKDGKKLAAAVIEPVVQGAAGICVAPPGYVKGFERLCRLHRVPLIADEVATGFGRTGALFAVQQEGARPDFMCVAKSITGGYLPLAATLTTQKIYRSFLGRFEEFKTFFHGHTYTANPLACAVALENLALYRRDKLMESLPAKMRILRGALKAWRGLPFVGDVRQAGLMAAVELVQNKDTAASFPPAWKIGQRVCRAARSKGLWIRPLGDCLVILPPLAISRKELRRMLDIVRESMTEVFSRA